MEELRNAVLALPIQFPPPNQFLNTSVIFAVRFWKTFRGGHGANRKQPWLRGNWLVPWCPSAFREGQYPNDAHSLLQSVWTTCTFREQRAWMLWADHEVHSRAAEGRGVQQSQYGAHMSNNVSEKEDSHVTVVTVAVAVLKPASFGYHGNTKCV